MNVKGLIVDQIDWNGGLKTLTMKPSVMHGDLWVAFSKDYEEPRSGPFYFQNPNYEKEFDEGFAECRTRKVSESNFFNLKGLFTFKVVWRNIETENQALTYYALYLPEFAVPTSVNIYDPENPEKKFKRTVLKDQQKSRYIVYLKCSSKFGKFNFNLDCQFKKDKTGFQKSTYTDEFQTDLYSNPESWQNFMRADDVEKTQKFFAEQIIFNSGNMEQVYKPAKDEKKKGKLELGHKIAIFGICLTAFVLLFGNDIVGRYFNKTTPKINSADSTGILEINDTSTVSMNLPYLQNVPIIDKGLFIKYYYTDFIIGGVNVDTLSINARTKTGEAIELRKDKDISMSISSEPFIEFNYKGKVYSIEILGQHYDFLCRIRKNIKPSLSLKKVNAY